MWSVIYLLVLLACLGVESQRQQQRLLTTANRITRYGYGSETHSVTTSDGYILNLFRIVPARNFTQQRPVVLMMHGLISSSDFYVINPEPRDALAFYLADRGYDVWLGNSRTNPYSYRHLSLKPNQSEFWNFSIHQLGTIDLPALIDYILQRTRQPRLHYVGHSQGTAILMILLSTQPQYGTKIKTGHLLAPIAFMRHSRAPLIEALAPLMTGNGPLRRTSGSWPLAQSRLAKKVFGLEYCRLPTASAFKCFQVVYLFAGGFSNYINQTLLPEIFSTHPASCSTQQLLHLVQLYNSGGFHAFDYGPKLNVQRYGKTKPPVYKLERIKTRFPLHLYYSNYDELSTKMDVEKLLNVMANNAVAHYIEHRKFAHFDFLWTSLSRKTVNEPMLATMSAAEASGY